MSSSSSKEKEESSSKSKRWGENRDHKKYIVAVVRTPQLTPNSNAPTTLMMSWVRYLGAGVRVIGGGCCEIEENFAGQAEVVTASREKRRRGRIEKNPGWPREQAADNKQEVAYYAIGKMLKQLQKNEKAKFIITGPSLGGALAILFPAILAFHKETWLLERLEGIYTFGQPRVGDENFGEFLNEQLRRYNIDYYRLVYSFDLVPRLPYEDSTFLFKHLGTCIYNNSFYQGKIVAEEPN
ncbi:unnamed protein product [Fraxinus pennsylvanica]|uniref:Fungal lipase-type domain-containing protein n=1 Tax=Fraxinus pennsylvanica TaxID=56036 RepID=A0AAD2E7C8_9LAMI|nr:unnamed protein product [Fraxinus pennsylvanica]